MKRIEAIIRPSAVGKVCLSLERAGYPRPRISQIEGESRKDSVYQLRGKAYDVDLMTRTRIEVTAKDSEADKIVDAIRDAAFKDDIGYGKIFVQAVEDALDGKIGDGKVWRDNL